VPTRTPSQPYPLYIICEDETVLVVTNSVSSKPKNEIGSTTQTVCTSSTKSSAKKLSMFSIAYLFELYTNVLSRENKDEKYRWN